ncbi:ROK family protein [Candidatus Parcubacteria bacterium]|nr:MAG: ROK family protein [Candidatus Parcubacteria bacterium]
MYLGLDIGGSKISAVLISQSKQIEDAKVKTPHTKELFKKTLLKLVSQFFNRWSGQIFGVGVGMAGVLDNKKGLVINSPNLTFLNGFNVISFLRQKFHTKVLVDNDARCFLRAEKLLGAAKLYKNVVGVVIGTGVGGALIIDNGIFRGSAGSAGEIGHTIIDKNSALENLASEKFFYKRTKKSPIEVARLARTGNKSAKKLYQEMGDNLGIGLANLINTINPEAVILGGGISNDFDLFLPSAIKTVRKLVLSPKAKKTKIIKAKFGVRAGAIGAATLFDKGI